MILVLFCEIHPKAAGAHKKNIKALKFSYVSRGAKITSPYLIFNYAKHIAKTQSYARPFLCSWLLSRCVMATGPMPLS